MGIISEIKEQIQDVVESFEDKLDDESLFKKLQNELEQQQTALFTKLLKNEPDKLFAVLRKTTPILSTPNGFIVTLFDDVQEALTRNDVFTVAPYAPKMDPSVGPYMLARDNTDINYRDKSVMRTVLRFDDLPNIRKMVADYTNEALDDGDGTIEVVEKLSRGVPISVTQDYFGFNAPRDDLFKWSYWTQADMFHNLTNDPKIHEKNVQSGQEMKAFLSSEIQKRYEAIKAGEALDDSFSRLVKLAANKDVTDFDDERIIANVMGLLVGGIETTSQAIVQILDQLIRVFPEKLKEATEYAKKGDDKLFDAYVWEALRFNPINPFVVRLTSQDYILAAGTMRETKIPKSSIVLLSTRSAMHDGKQLPDAEEFRIDRPDYHYMHLGFGAHECLGKYVGMVEITEIVKQILLRGEVNALLEPEFTKPSPFPEKYVINYKA